MRSLTPEAHPKLLSLKGLGFRGLGFRVLTLGP